MGDLLLAQKASSVRGIFMHIHKCAGTSLIEAFAPEPAVLCCAARPGIFAGRTGRERISDEIWRRSLKFTVIRNPYARVASAYRMFCRTARWRELFPDFDRFVDFLRWTDVRGHRIDREIATGDLNNSIETLLHHCSSYQNPKYCIEEMDRICRLESIDVDVKAIAKELGTSFGPLPLRNQSRHEGTYRDLYSPRARAIVEGLFGEDIERFGYSF